MTTSTAGETPVPPFRRELHPVARSASAAGTRSTPHRVSAATSPTTWCSSTTTPGQAGTTRGWCPYGPFSLDPATMVLHYGQEIFEGLKVFAQPDGSIAAFRPEAERGPVEPVGRPAGHPAAARGAVPGRRSGNCWRSTAPGCPPAANRRCTSGRSSSPPRSGSASGRRRATSSASSPRPPGRTSRGGVKPVSVWWSTEYVRAAPGGTGAAKFGGNYAASLAAQAQAAEKGCDQVVWLDAVERRWVEEMGGMNLFFVLRRRVRPPSWSPRSCPARCCPASPGIRC